MCGKPHLTTDAPITPTPDGVPSLFDLCQASLLLAQTLRALLEANDLLTAAEVGKSMERVQEAIRSRVSLSRKHDQTKGGYDAS